MPRSEDTGSAVDGSPTTIVYDASLVAGDRSRHLSEVVAALEEQVAQGRDLGCDTEQLTADDTARNPDDDEMADLPGPVNGGQNEPAG